MCVFHFLQTFQSRTQPANFRGTLEHGRCCSCNTAFPIPGIPALSGRGSTRGALPQLPPPLGGHKTTAFLPRAKAPVTAAHIRGNRYLSQSQGMRNLCSTNQKPDGATSVPSCPGAARTPPQPWMLLGSSGHSGSAQLWQWKEKELCSELTKPSWKGSSRGCRVQGGAPPTAGCSVGASAEFP